MVHNPSKLSAKAHKANSRPIVKKEYWIFGSQQMLQHGFAVIGDYISDEWPNGYYLYVIWSDGVGRWSQMIDYSWTIVHSDTVPAFYKTLLLLES